MNKNAIGFLLIILCTFGATHKTQASERSLAIITLTAIHTKITISPQADVDFLIEYALSLPLLWSQYFRTIDESRNAFLIYSNLGLSIGEELNQKLEQKHRSKRIYSQILEKNKTEIVQYIREAIENKTRHIPNQTERIAIIKIDLIRLLETYITP